MSNYQDDRRFSDERLQFEEIEQKKPSPPSELEDSNYVDKMEKSAISASSAFNVELRMQELKQKKNRYLNQGDELNRQAQDSMQAFNMHPDFSANSRIQ